MTPEEGIEQADVMRRYYEQQTLPEEQRDILEYRERHCTQWLMYSLGEPRWKFCDHEYRLRKRPKKHVSTVYWYRYGNGRVVAQTTQCQWPGVVLLGTSTIEFTEPGE